jgi:fumarylpyruvate hydrolase
MSLLFPLAPPSVAIQGKADRFPVRRIYCVGRNYADHVREMGGDPNAEPPIFFMKPADAATNATEFPFTVDTDDLHHEIELVIALKGAGANLSPEAARDLVYGYAVGLDLTKRDRQNELKAKGAPWERAKSFDRGAPMSAIVPAAEIGHPERGLITLSINGAVRQQGDLAQMILSPMQILAELSKIWTLGAGDLIFTGTPAGIGPIRRGDAIKGGVEGVGEIAFKLS